MAYPTCSHMQAPASTTVSSFDLLQPNVQYLVALQNSRKMCNAPFTFILQQSWHVCPSASHSQTQIRFQEPFFQLLNIHVHRNLHLHGLFSQRCFTKLLTNIIWNSSRLVQLNCKLELKLSNICEDILQLIRNALQYRKF